jgi:TRAP-type C4-dicarboxylate transport system permease small subunit
LAERAFCKSEVHSLMGIFQLFRRFLEKMEKVQKALCSLFLGVIVVVLSLEILLRNLLGVNLQWALDLSALLMVWICFIGASMVYWRKGHIGIEALLTLFPKPLQKTINILMFLVIGAGFVVLMIKAASLLVVQYGQEIVSLGLSRSFLSFPVVLGIGLMIFVSVYLIFEEIFGPGGKEMEPKQGGGENYDESY